MVNNPTHYSGIRSEGRIESTPQGVLVGLVDSLPSASVAGAGTVVLVKGTGKFHVSNGSAWTEQKLVATSSADKVTVNTTLQNDSNAVAGSVVYSLQNTLEEQIRQVEESIPDDTVTTAQMNSAAGEAKTSAVSESKSYTDTQLGSYYKKTEIDSEVATLENKISAIPKFTMSVVSSLPSTGDSATLYIVGTAGSDSAKEYIYVNGAWELIGDIRITVANTVAQNNGNPVSSGAVYTALQGYLPLNGKAKDSEKADHATSADTATTATNATNAANATTAGSATKATQDASGNVITSTYATKNELSGEVSSLNSAINAVSQSVEGKMDDTPVDAAPTSGSANLVTSGGVYDAINTLSEGIPSGGEAGQVWTSDGAGAGKWANAPSGEIEVEDYGPVANPDGLTHTVITRSLSSLGSASSSSQTFYSYSVGSGGVSNDGLYYDKTNNQLKKCRTKSVTFTKGTISRTTSHQCSGITNADALNCFSFLIGMKVQKSSTGSMIYLICEDKTQVFGLNVSVTSNVISGIARMTIFANSSTNAKTMYDGSAVWHWAYPSGLTTPFIPLVENTTKPSTYALILDL